MKEVYVGMGGNIGDSYSILEKALNEMAACPDISALTCSSFYSTKPVSDIPQNDYINAVCRFHTSLSASQTLSLLQMIERKLGKKEKPKNMPRLIDLDILFFDNEFHDTAELAIPHPAWQSRLFVLVPLAELTKQLNLSFSPSCRKQVSIPALINSFSIEEKKSVIPLNRQRGSYASC